MALMATTPFCISMTTGTWHRTTCPSMTLPGESHKRCTLVQVDSVLNWKVPTAHCISCSSTMVVCCPPPSLLSLACCPPPSLLYWHVVSFTTVVMPSLTHYMCRTLDLSLLFHPISLFKFQMYAAMTTKSQWADFLGSTETSDEEQDTLKVA